MCKNLFVQVIFLKSLGLNTTFHNGEILSDTLLLPRVQGSHFTSADVIIWPHNVKYPELGNYFKLYWKKNTLLLFNAFQPNEFFEHHGLQIMKFHAYYFPIVTLILIMYTLLSFPLVGSCQETQVISHPNRSY